VNLLSLLSRTARLSPEAPAIAHGDVVACSYRALAERVASLAAFLSGPLGRRPGDRVAIVAGNCAEYLEVLFACWHAGLVAVPVNSKLHPKELEFIFVDSGAEVAFTTPDLSSSVPASATVIEVGSREYARATRSADAVPIAAVGGDDPAWLFYTSGTTGQPKGAVLTHTNLLQMSLAYVADIERVVPGHTILHAAPMSHGSGLYALPHVAGGSLNLIPESGGFDTDEVLAAIEQHPRVSFFAAPTMVTRLLANAKIGDADLRQLETIIYGGAPMYLSDVLRAIECLGPRLFNLYGQGESPMTIAGLPQSVHADSAHPRFHARLGSCGLPRSGVELRIVDEAGTSLAAGEVGEIRTRSACTMAGYWRNPEATERALRDGWLCTGDLGSIDEDGFLTLRDRSKDLIISGGSNIYPREVEEVLLGDARVSECSVVGRPHADWGEEVVAFVVRAPDAALEADQLDALCLENIARFKRPKQYRFVEALPKNNYGKVLKTELRRRLSGAADLGVEPSS
jgi:long-chain acyl-CoA synthetase